MSQSPKHRWIWFLGFLATAGATLAGTLTPTALRTEYLENPTGLDETSPRLEWRVESLQRAQKQTAYQVLVASTPALLEREKGDLWDSGKVKSSLTTQIVYGGKTLTSRQAAWWKVRVWDGKDRASRWSAPAHWTMGLLQPGDWTADWISHRDKTPVWNQRDQLQLPPARYYRKEFEAGRKIQRAFLYATALGIYELELNGRKVSDRFFAPGWTDYRRRAYYQAYDVTAMVAPGGNCLGAILADGWYAGYLGYGLLVGYGPNKSGRNFYGKTPALLAQLELEYTDGTRETLGTDNSWRVTSEGPIREADFLMGETYEANRELPGWSRPGFDAATWEPAIRAGENGPAPATYSDTGGSRQVDLGFVRPAVLQAYPGPAVKITETIRPCGITEPMPGVYLVNMGQNFAGLVRLQVKGPAGTKIRLRYGEMLHPDGRLMTENLRRARATDYYVLRGDPQGETWQPRFTFHGFQYVELTGFPGRPELETLNGLVLHSSTPLVSDFECSDAMANKLFKNIVWTQRANFLELPTDCPQRDERFGWMGDAQAYIRAATYNADTAAFYSKWLREVEEAQLPSGAYPDYCPWPMQHGQAFATGWTDAGLICPWTVWQAYGDTRVLERHWDSMKRFMDWRQKVSPDGLGVVHGNEWGDWLSLSEKTPLDYLDTVYYAWDARLMSEMAAALERKDEADAYDRLFKRIKEAFTRKYLKPDGTLQVDTQTAYAVALFTGLIPEALQARAAARLAEKIIADETRMGTGFLGTRPLLPVLSQHDYNDLAVRLFQSRKYPSWGYEVENGATTIWERWNSYTTANGFGGGQNAAMNSFSHYAFGAVCEWMFDTLAGIRWGAPGYRQIIIHPHPPRPDGNPGEPPINWVRARFDSPMGRIVSAWRQTDQGFELEATIPANTTATVYLPAKTRESITEGGTPLNQLPEIKFAGLEHGYAILEIGSGIYRLASGKNR